MTKARPTTESRAILLALMEAEPEGVGYLSSSDLAALLLHQLRTALELEIDDLQASHGATEIAPVVSASRHETFGDVVQHADAGDPLLRLVKEHGKKMLTNPSGLPAQVAHFLYVASVLRARVVGDSTVSTLSDAVIDSEARRLLTAAWLPEEARQILRAGLAG